MAVHKPKNFARATANQGYDAAATSIQVQSGQGAKFPAGSFFFTWWNVTDYAEPGDDPNVEIGYCTTRTGDVLTVTRGQLGITATVKNLAGKTYRLLLGIYDATLIGAANSVQGTNAAGDGIEAKTLVSSGPVVITHGTGSITLDAKTPTQASQGLVLMNHPDHDVVSTKLMLVGADYLTLQDGYRVTPTAKLVLDKQATAGGQGAWDTTPVVSSCNEIWYARKSSDGTDCLIGHRAKDWFKDQEQATDDSSNNYMDVTGNQGLAQSFQISATLPIDHLMVRLAKVGSPTGQFWFTLEADSSGNPSGTPLATSEKLDIAQLTTTKGWIAAVFRTPATFTVTTTYWLRLQSSLSVNASNYLVWGSSAASTYGPGASKKYNGSTWSASTNLDQAFRIFVRRNDTVVALPSGFDQKALIGYCHIDASGNLKRMRALDRRVTLLNDVAGSSGHYYLGNFGTAATLVDLQSAVPPRPVRVQFRYGPTATGADQFQAAHHAVLTNLNGTDNSKYGIPVDARTTFSSGRAPVPVPPIFCEEALAVMATQAGNANEVYATHYDW